MSKHGSARAVLAGAVLITLAGCTGVGMGTAPEVPGQSSGTRPASSSASSAASSAAPVSTARQSAAAGPFARADSIPFPVAVGNTWVYRTTAGGATGRMTNRIVAAGPGTAGYLVRVSSTTAVAGTAATVQPVYVFYPDGTIGYPVPQVNGLSVAGASIRWPDAAGLASGRVYHSVLRVQVGQAAQNADVTVHGAGTTPVTVPAGSYRASVVETTIAAKGMTVEVTSWIAQGVGPVETVVLIQAAGGTELATTNVLLSFTRATSAVGDGS